ncbi:MAG: DNA-methyltransferase [Candidatus Heimdallarchaeaceae archaeon]
MNNLLNVIHNINCFELFPKIPDKSVDLVLTDPPYGINYKSWDKFIDFNEFMIAWLSECFRVLKPTGTMWSFMGYQNIFDFVPLLQQYGDVHLENWVVWARQKGRGSSKHLKSVREDIFHITKSDKFTWNNVKILRDAIWAYKNIDGSPRGWFVNEKGERKRWTGLGNVWVFSSPFWKSKNEDAYLHPAQKPVAMIERLVLLSSNEGDVVLDPFSGSGVTAIACERWKRKYICIEKNKEYYDDSVKRLERFRKDETAKIF